jgi:hypothetical protein
MTQGGFGGDPFGGQSFGDPFGGGFQSQPPIYSAPPPQSAPPETNTLATLSVVFAFVFAPAGAVLGHLGLSQIARTGQRGHDRAVVGIALSYSVIVIAVTALVVWSVTGNDSTGTSVTATASHTSTLTTTSRTTSTTTSSAPPPATDADYPQPTLVPGRTMTAADLPSLLLNLDEVKAIMAKGGDDSATPTLTPQPPVTSPIPFPGPQGTVTPDDCASVFTSGSASAYQDLGYQALYSVSMTEPRSYGEQIVVQTATVFDSSDAAVRALTGYLNKAWQCRDRPDNPRSNMKFDVVDPGGTVKQLWDSVGVLGRFGNYYLSSCQRYQDNMAPGSYYTISRGWVAKGNVLLDVSVRGGDLDGPAQYMVMALMKKLG